MAKIQNVSGQDLIVPWLGDRLVHDEQVVDVADDQVYAYTQQELWRPYGEATEVLHEAAAIVAEADQLVTNGGPLSEPDGNASRVEWGAYVVATHLAEPSELEDLSRDQIRETYEQPAVDPDQPPSGNAPRDEWAAYAVASGQATADEVAGLGRNELRETYGKPVDDDEPDQTPVDHDGTEADQADDNNPQEG